MSEHVRAVSSHISLGGATATEHSGTTEISCWSLNPGDATAICGQVSKAAQSGWERWGYSFPCQSEQH